MRISSQKEEKKQNTKLRLVSFSILLIGVGIFLGWKDIPGHLKANFVVLQKLDLWEVIKEKNSLPNLKLEISFKGIQALDAKRKEALDTGLLVSSKNDFVKAKISNLNESFSCKVRLKGDLADHWSGEKFSLRVEMKDGSLIRGMSRFSLQDPITRNNTSEWLFQQSLKREGLMGVRYEFVNLFINGRFMGIYAMEEHFSKELIESNSKREGVVVNFNDALLWKKFPVNLSSNIDWNSFFRSAPVEVRNNNRVQKNEVLNNQKVTAINLLRSLQESRLPASKIFDSEKLGKFLAITRLWSAEKGLFYGDINFYFNPVTCLLEPIGFDGNPSQEIVAPYCYFSWGDIKENWVNYSLSDPRIAFNYVAWLFKFTDKEYLSLLASNLRSRELSFRNLLSRELLFGTTESIWKNFGLITFDPWSNLELRTQGIIEELNENFLIQGYGKRSNDISNNYLEIIVRNTTTQPIEIKGFSLGDKFWSANRHLVGNSERKPSVHFNQPDSNVILFGQGNGFRQTEKDKEFIIQVDECDEPLVAHVRFLGSPNSYIDCAIPVNELTFDPELLPTNKLSGLNQDSFPFILDENESLWIPPGSHVCRENLYIPANLKLKISPGAKILFDRNCTFVSESPIHFLGTKAAPIIISSMEDSWPGFLLANASSPSVFENVELSTVSGIGKEPNTNGIRQNGWTLTGGITVYNSPVEFRSCSFINFNTEDALNIISSMFSISDCKFSDHYSDAFDGDFVVGSISDCYFTNIAGDGVDFSGSSAFLRNCFFKSVEDKAVSVGEGSNVKVYDCKIEDVSFGVVSKDMSTTEVLDNTVVSDAKIAAFAAFQKKDSFGAASIKISNSQTIDCQNLALIQEGSQGSFNGEIIETVSFQASDLYKTK